MSENTIEYHVEKIIELIGDNPKRQGLCADPNDRESLSTSQRVAIMYRDFFCGYNKERFPRIMTIPNGQDGVHYDQMLIDQGYFFTFCEHHILPFFGEYYYGYIPNEKVMGTSKIGRIIDYYCGRLQIAERLVNQVVSIIDDIVKPTGQVLVMKARHLCKEMRGLKKYNSPFEAIAVRGCFAKNDKGCKDEFMMAIGRR